MSSEQARQTAQTYQYEAVEFKETSHRTDGVFLPKSPELPLYFVEVQFYSANNIFANILAKVFTYLKQHDPGQEFRSVVLFASRALEPKELAPYRALLSACQLRSLYLDELELPAEASLGLSILHLIRESETQAPAFARELIARVKIEVADEELRADLIELIETVLVYKLSHLSREEIQAMLKVHDIRETRVYREAKEEGREEVIAIAKLAAKQMSAEEIAASLKLDLELVHQVLGVPTPIQRSNSKEEGVMEGIVIAAEIAKLTAKGMSAEEIAAQLNLDLVLVHQALAKLRN